MAKTFKNLFGDGITHGDDGTTYRTTKDVIGDGYTTHGSDGSTYKTHKRLLGDGYTTSKISDGSRNEYGVWGVIAPFVVVLILLACCASVLTVKSYICVAGLVIAPKLTGICERLRISKVWCSGVLFCFAAVSVINSFYNDTEAVGGGEGLITLIFLFIILCLGIMFVVFKFEGSECGAPGTGFLTVLVLVISLAWCYLNVFATIPYTHQMTRCALGLLCIFAIIDQIALLRQHRTKSAR